MKKTLCIILGLTILISAFSVFSAYADQVDSQSLDVAQVHIVTNDNVGLSLKKADGYVGATVTIIDKDGNQVGGEAQVKVRGNSTSGLNKKPYTFKFTKKTDVLGMGKAKKWALLANMFDPTLLRNNVGINTAAELGLDYTSQIKVVEVWMDGSFRGCYNLIEPVQAGSTRVDIDIESNNGMNDFMIEREYNRNEEGAVYFKTNSIRFVCSEPEEPTEEQVTYIQSTMDDLADIMQHGSRAQIEEKIDLDSFAKYYVLNEFVKAVDFDYSSVFFYYKNGKLYAGPAWDYDLSMGNEDPAASANYEASSKTDGLHCNTKHFYKWLCKYPWFFDLTRKVYLEHSDYFNNIGTDGGFIDSQIQEFSAPIERNFSKTGANWNQTAYYKNFNRKPDNTYHENVDYLKNWCLERASWLDDYYTDDVISYKLGDSDNNNDLNIIDVTLIQRKLALISVSCFDSICADVDGDGKLTIIDATYIQRFLANYSTPNPIGDVLWRKDQV